MEVNGRAILLRHKKAIEVVRRRAEVENRTAANCLSTIVLESENKQNNAPEVVFDLNSTLENVVRQVFILYKRTYCSKRKLNTSLSQNRLEPDIIKYFLQGFTNKETTRAIKEKKGIKISKPAIGRYYTRLQKIGALSGIFPRG